MKIIICIITFIFMCPLGSYAETIYLNNGDKISGNIIAEEKNSISIESTAMGIVSIKRNMIKSIENKKDVPEPKKDKNWKREISIGYNKTDGNTKESQFSMNLYANRKTDIDEFTIKGNVYYSSSNDKMDSQKWYTMTRYARSFWDKEWYNFYKFEADHDRFANINYRLVPSAGVGYWFSDTDGWKAMLECGMGFEYVKFRDDSKDSLEPIIIPRAFFEKKLFEHTLISQEFILYPSLKDSGEYRMHSESALTNPINDKLSLKFSLIDDYNSSPAPDVKKNDWRLISSLVYSF